MTLIVWNNSIPAAGNNPSADQGQMLSNNISNPLIWAIDHIGFNVNNSGLHQQVRMPNFTTYPVAPIPPNVLSGFGGLYCDNTTSVGAGNETGLWYTEDATSNKYQLTRTINAAFALFGKNTNNYNAVGTKYTGGWTWLPGGLLLQYGTYNNGVLGLGSSGTVTFPVAFSATPFIVLPVLLCPSLTSSQHTLSVLTTGVSSTQFVWNMDAATTSYSAIYWVAIGA